MDLRLQFARQAEKQLRRLPRKIRERVNAKLLELASQPFPRGTAKLQGNTRYWRVRVGDYRIVYTVESERRLLIVTKVANRDNVYHGVEDL